MSPGPRTVLGDPLTVVDLDRDPAPEPATGRIVIGWSSDPARVPDAMLDRTDLTLVPAGSTARSGSRSATDPRCVPVPDRDAGTAELRAAVTANPHAAVVLAGLLRWSPGLTVPAALEAESLAYSMLLGGPEFARWLAGRGDRPPPPDVDDPVLPALDGDRLRITLNRPRRRNAYGRQLRDALVDALDVAETLAAARPGLGVVIDGAGPCFCSGGDLAEFGTTPDPVTAHLVRTAGGAAAPLHRLAARTEIRVHGPCVGAGVELAAFAGRVVAHEDTTFRLPEIAMGLIPGAGGTVGVPRRIGRARTLHLALTGRTLDTPTALAWGLVDAVGTRPEPPSSA